MVSLSNKHHSAFPVVTYARGCSAARRAFLLDLEETLLAFAAQGYRHGSNWLLQTKVSQPRRNTTILLRSIVPSDLG